MDYFDPIAILNSSGAVEERYTYSAFGVPLILAPDYSTRSSSAFDWGFLFHGQFTDAETGYQNYGFRYYMPDTGRWASQDPNGEQGGMNLYEVVRNEPINSIDILGLEGVFEITELMVEHVMDRANGGVTLVTEAPGFDLKYFPDGASSDDHTTHSNPRSCPASEGTIRLVQAYDYLRTGAAIDTSTLLRNRNNANAAPPPGMRESGAPPGSTRLNDYQDAPGAGHALNSSFWSKEGDGVKFYIETCAYCECKKTRSRKLLGCVVFTVFTRSGRVDVDGGVRGIANPKVTRVPETPTEGELMRKGRKLWEESGDSV